MWGVQGSHGGAEEAPLPFIYFYIFILPFLYYFSKKKKR